MIRFGAAAAMLFTTCGLAAAQAPKADCSNFYRTSDGRWASAIMARVGNPKDFKQLQPGLPIDRSMTVAGLNVSATLDRLCGGR